MMDKLKRFSHGFGLCLLCLVLSLPGQPLAAQTAPPQGIDIVFALDISGSMSDDIGNLFQANTRDKGLATLMNNAPNDTLSLAATDPEGVRLDAVQFMLKWLARFLQDDASRFNSGIDVRAQVVVFNQATRRLTPDWLTVSLDTPGFFDGVEMPETTGRSESDFYVLAETVNALFGSSPQRQKLLFIVTDSVPCNSTIDDMFIGDAVAYSEDCQQYDKMLDHLDAAGRQLSSSIQPYIYFLTPPEIPAGTFWENRGARGGMSDIRNFWQVLTENRGTFREMNRIDALPAAMFADIQSVLVETLGGEGTDATQLGIVEDKGQFTVPPYMARMDVVMFVDGSREIPALTPPGGTAAAEPVNLLTVSDSTEPDGMILMRYDQPPPGRWSVGGGYTVWLMFQPAKAFLSIERKTAAGFEAAAQVQQYDIVRFVYEIKAGSGNLPPLASYPLQLDVIVTTPGGENFTLEGSAETSRWVSDEFMVLAEDDYQVAAAAQPANSWRAQALQRLLNEDPATETDNISGFLTPEDIPMSVQPVEAIIEWGGSKEADAIIQTDRQTRLFRSQVLPFRVYFDPPLPDLDTTLFGLDVTPSGDGCDDHTLNWDGTQWRGAAAFQTAGATAQCEVRVELQAEDTRTSPVQPLQPGEPASLRTFSSVAVTVDTTERFLPYLLVNGVPADADPAAPVSYTMNDFRVELQPMFPFWKYDSLNIEAAFRDAAGQEIEPRYASSATPAGTVVPFRVSLVRVGDETTSYAVAPYVNLIKIPDSPKYTLTVTGLPAGDYRLSLDLLALNASDPVTDDSESFRLATQNEIDPTALVEERKPVLTGLLSVRRNPPVYAVSVAAVLFVLVVVFLIYRRIRAGIGSLDGAVAIVRRGDSAPLWRSSTPPRGWWNTCKFDSPQFAKEAPELVTDLQIKYLKVSTGGSRAWSKEGKISYEYAITGSQTRRSEPDKPLEKNQAIRLNGDYYLVRLDSMTAPLQQVKFQD